EARAGPRRRRVTAGRCCRDVRFAAARDAGLDESQVARIDEGFAESSLSERHKTVIRWTDAFLVEPCGQHEELRAALLRQLDAAQVVELTAGLALFMGFSKIAVVLGQEPEDMPTTVIPTPVRPE